LPFSNLYFFYSTIFFTLIVPAGEGQMMHEKLLLSEMRIADKHAAEKRRKK
jgi:hypothetical protein